MGLNELQTLKDTLLKIDDINKKLDESESSMNYEIEELNNLKDIEIPSRSSLKMKTEVVVRDFTSYSVKEIRRELRENNWASSFAQKEGSIDVLRLEYVKMRLYNEYMKKTKKQLIDKYVYYSDEKYAKQLSKDLLVKFILDKDFTLSEKSPHYKKSLEHLKQSCENYDLPTGGKKTTLIARILYAPYRKELAEKTEIFSFDDEELKNKIASFEDEMEHESIEHWKERGELEKFVSRKEEEVFIKKEKLSKLKSTYFGNESPTILKAKSRLHLKKQLSNKKSILNGITFFPIIITLSLTISTTLSYIVLIIVVIIFLIINRTVNQKIIKFEQTENQRIDGLEQELHVQIKEYDDLNDKFDIGNDEISAAKSEIGQLITSFTIKKRELYKSYSRNKDRFRAINDAKKQHLKDKEKLEIDIERKTKNQKSVEIERGKRTNRIDQLKRDINNLEKQKTQLWEEIKHLIPYSNLLRNVNSKSSV
jgi:hypothetical protein